MKKLITISREFGAGGGEIGRQVASALGWNYYDKDLILAAARSANVDVSDMRSLDERVPFTFGFGQSLFDMYNSPLDERLFDAQKKVIQKMGEHGHCVIVGRNANVILKEYDYSLHVFIHADENWRVRRMKAEKMPDSSEQEILKHLRAVDKTRRRYCSYYTKTEFGASDYYDISLCTSTLGIDNCIKVITDLARLE